MYNYNEERNSVEWQRKVDEIRQRDNYTCQLCGAQDKQVQVHHTWYNQKLHYWEYPNEQLITLCKECHAKETDLVRRLKKIRPSLDSDIVSSFRLLMQKGVLLAKIQKAFEQMGIKAITTSENGTNSIQYSYKVLLSIEERKLLFIQALKPFESKYDKDYIQTFLEYWLTEKKGVLRFEIGENGDVVNPLGITSDYMDIKLENWKLKYDFIVQGRQSALILDEMEKRLMLMEEDYEKKNIELRCRLLRNYNVDRLLGKLLYEKGLYVEIKQEDDSFLKKYKYTSLCYPIESIVEEEQKALSDFYLLYEAKQAFKLNKTYNRTILSSIDPQITYKSFCDEHGIKYPRNLKNDKSIQEMVNSQEYPIKIEYHDGLIDIRNPIQPKYNDLYKKLNEVMGLKLFITPFQSPSFIKVPYQILYRMDGTQFDFRDDSFENGTMKSIKLPTEFKDTSFYIEKIKEMIYSKRHK